MKNERLKKTKEIGEFLRKISGQDQKGIEKFIKFLIKYEEGKEI